MRGLRTLLAALLLALPAYGAAETSIHDPRVKALADELRCLVCQNQTIADSSAPLAVDLRQQIVKMIDAGKTDREIIAYMTERYGDFVLYRPPFRATTALLWVGPFVLLLGGLVIAFRIVRARARAGAAPELSSEDHIRARELLK
jgi:cytochrome c-type biogenesis protein CcmH